MGFLHGYTGTISWTAGSGESGETVRTAALSGFRIHPRRRLVECTPFSWDCETYIPDIYGWTAELDFWVEDNVQPGFFNKVEATLVLRTRAAVVPVYNGLVWIEDIRLGLSIDNATKVTFLVRGNGALARTA